MINKNTLFANFQQKQFAKRRNHLRNCDTIQNIYFNIILINRFFFYFLIDKFIRYAYSF